MEYQALALGTVAVATVVATFATNKLIAHKNKEFYKGLAQVFRLDRYDK